MSIQVSHLQIAGRYCERGRACSLTRLLLIWLMLLIFLFYSSWGYAALT